MSIYSAVTSCLLAAVGIVLGYYGARSVTSYFAEQPELAIREFDFVGSQWQKAKDTPTYSLVLTNIGKGLLEINEIEGSCGCAEIQMEKRRLMPGEESQLRIAIESAAAIPNVIAIRIVTNEAVNNVHVWHLPTRNRDDARLSARSILFQREADERGPTSLRIFWIVDQKRRFDSMNPTVASSSPYVSARVLRDPLRQRFVIEVSLRRDSPSGNWSTSIHVADSTFDDEHVVGVSVRRPSGYIMPVSDIVCCDETVESDAEWSLMVSHRREGIAITNVSFSKGIDGYLGATTATVDDGRATIIRLQWKRPPRTGISTVHEGKNLLLHVNDTITNLTDVHCIPLVF